mmetsp:Transcript_31236/g.70665  ORF Transcript_31236/g.70665 Transcript_31236/m.70665 type:complete len:201 (-) Transcript_31236:1269-1871(-)
MTEAQAFVAVALNEPSEESAGVEKSRRPVGPPHLTNHIKQTTENYHVREDRLPPFARLVSNAEGPDGRAGVCLLLRILCVHDNPILQRDYLWRTTGCGFGLCRLPEFHFMLAIECRSCQQVGMSNDNVSWRPWVCRSGFGVADLLPVRRRNNFVVLPAGCPRRLDPGLRRSSTLDRTRSTDPTVCFQGRRSRRRKQQRRQ